MKRESSIKKDSKSVVGVWQVKEIGRQNIESAVTDKPFPNIFIFMPRHYSMVWALGASEPFAERWKPTDEEKIERFDSLVVNAGTYEIDGATIIAHPIIARIPDFVGGKLICEFSIDRDTMQLKFMDEYSFDGVQAPWVAKGGLVMKLVRIGSQCCDSD